jgi:hypothetical protein
VRVSVRAVWLVLITEPASRLAATSGWPSSVRAVWLVLITEPANRLAATSGWPSAFRGSGKNRSPSLVLRGQAGAAFRASCVCL